MRKIQYGIDLLRERYIEERIILKERYIEKKSYFEKHARKWLI